MMNDPLRSAIAEQNELYRERGNLSPGTSTYQRMTKRIEQLTVEIAQIEEKRLNTRPYEASYGVETIQGSGVLAPQAA